MAIEIKKVGEITFKYHLGKIKELIFDDEKDKALAMIESIAKQLDGEDTIYCERCNAYIPPNRQGMGEMCESCCYELGFHSQRKD